VFVGDLEAELRDVYFLGDLLLLVLFWRLFIDSYDKGTTFYTNPLKFALELFFRFGEYFLSGESGLLFGSLAWASKASLVSTKVTFLVTGCSLMTSFNSVCSSFDLSELCRL